MKLLTVAAHDLPKLLPMRDAVEAMKSAFASLSAGQVVAPLRGVVPVDEVDGVSLLMGGYVPREGLVAKTVSIFNRNRDLGKDVVTGLVLVLDPASMSCVDITMESMSPLSASFSKPERGGPS